VAEGLEQHQKAIDNYKIALDLDPSQTILFINMSQMYFHLRDYLNALVWIKKARAAGEQVDHVYIEKLEQQVSQNIPPRH
jgi:tetratricopeptide (TPR) repeat protein